MPHRAFDQELHSIEPVLAAQTEERVPPEAKMTSVDFGVVAAPCCGTRYTAPQGAFINLEGWKEWSDGYGARDRSVTPKSVCECACGSLFLVSDVHPVVDEPREGTELVRQDSEPPRVVPYLTNARAGVLVEASTTFANPIMAYEVRLFHWRALNHARREWNDERARDWHEQGCWTDLGDTERDRLIAENAQQLLPILETHHRKDTLLLGEVHRILGNTDRAIECFSRTEFSYPVARERLIRLAREADTRVIQIVPLGRSGNPLKMPEPRRNPNPRGPTVAIRNRRYYFNPACPASSGRWALIDSDDEIFRGTLYFIGDDSEIHEVRRGGRLFVPSSELAGLGYKRWDRLMDLWEDYVPPGGPFFIMKDSRKQ